MKPGYRLAGPATRFARITCFGAAGYICNPSTWVSGGQGARIGDSSVGVGTYRNSLEVSFYFLAVGEMPRTSLGVEILSPLRILGTPRWTS